MLKVALLWLLALGAVLSATLLAADEADWKPESEEVALRFLEESRQAAGEMCRFEFECLRSEASPVFETEERSRVRAYCEPSVGFIFECHPVNGALLHTSRRGRGGEPYSVRSRTSETWLMSGAICTVVDEERRTYEGAKVERDDWLLGPLLTDLPQHIVPPVFDPTIDLRSHYRIDQAQSTPREFCIGLVPRKPSPTWRSDDDERLESRHQLWIDRRTHLPTRWWMKPQRSEQEITCIYTRFDIDPPPRELKVSLTGYREIRRASIPLDQVPTPESPTKPGALEVTARVLWWLLF